VALIAALPAPRSHAQEVAALTLAEGSVARHQLVAVGQDLEVRGQALSHVAALEGSVEVSGGVAGDVIVLGGSARLLEGSRIEGDVFVIGGVLEAASGSWIGGRGVSYPSVSEAWLTLLEGPSLGLEPWSPLVIGAKLALLTGWLALVLLLLSASGREVMNTSVSVVEEPFLNFAVGFVAVLALVLSALFFSAFAALLVGLPLVFLAVLLALLLKLWGMVAVFHAVGAWLAERLAPRRPLPLSAAALGLLVLGGLKFVPWLGLWTWWVASFVGIGAALGTKFGRREPWFPADVVGAHRGASWG
jgi:hypothetical protein